MNMVCEGLTTEENLYDVVACGATEEDVSTQPTVVAAGELLQHPALSVAHHVELGQRHVRVNLVGTFVYNGLGRA